MNTLLVAIPVSAGDVDLVLGNLKRMAEMEEKVGHLCILCTTTLPAEGDVAK